MPNTIDDLREELFATLKDLRDKETPFDVARAKAIIGVAGVIVDTARVEVAMLEATGAKGTGFITERPALTTGGGTPAQRQLREAGRR